MSTPIFVIHGDIVIPMGGRYDEFDKPLGKPLSEAKMQDGFILENMNTQMFGLI